ncbi:MAG TPA: cysteine desulfurase family protein [Dermatophilaceae bacterium]|nr:cysteine desulfurase family protein [Dermatophilaceae bacterium]
MSVYLDHAATTPVHPAVADAMAEQLGRVGNASSLHTAGRAARRVVEESRERLAAALVCRPSEIVFTSGGTESDNLAITGVYRARRDEDPRRRRLLVSAIEHHAVLDCVEALVAREGAEVVWLPCDAAGFVSVDAAREAIEEAPESVALVSMMWANNEVGTVQDVAALAALAREHGIPMHTDAVQAVGHLPVDVTASGVDLLSLTAHKVGGPVGVGGLVVKRDRPVVPIVYGGGQERQIRSGTLDTVGILGLSLAVERAVAEQPAEAIRLAALRDALIAGACAASSGITPGGVWRPGDTSSRLPGNAHLLVEGCEGDSLLYLLDAAGIECSTGSACQAGVPQPSHVLLAMGLSDNAARGALRLTLGHPSTRADVDAVVAALPAAVERARRAAGVA